MFRYRALIIIFLFWIQQLCCLGSEHTFSNLSIENGLSNNHVNAIFKDSYGFIWLGTLDGIDRYDGVEIKPFSYRFSGEVETVTAITEDFHKTLWVGTTTGLFRYNVKNDRFEQVNLDNHNQTVNGFALLHDNNLCVGTSDGLYLVNTISFQSEKLHISGESAGQNMNVTGILLDDQSKCWMATSKGLVTYSFADKKSELFRFNLVPQDAYNSFSSICSIDNTLFLGTTSVGIIEFDLSNHIFSKGESLDNNIILNVTSDNKELVFVGTDGGGLKVINTRTHEVENYIRLGNDPGSLSSNSVYSFLLDDIGRYWVGTYSAGLSFTKNVSRNFKIHPISSDYLVVDKSIRSFYFSPDGSQYFGTRNGLAILTSDDEYEADILEIFKASIEDDAGLRSNIILSVFPFMDDILIGTYGGGLSRFSVSDRQIKPFLENNFLSQGNIYAFDLDDSGNLWITSFNGIYRYSTEDQSLDHFNTQNSGLENDQIFDITFDTRGRMWIGSMSGTHAYNYSTSKLEPIDLSVIHDNTFKTNYIYEDQAGNIWICTERGGLIKVNPELTESKLYRDDDGLSDNSVCAIIERNPGEYWISTLKGLCKYSIQSNKFTACYISDGLPGPVFTPAATYLSPDGTVFFGNEKGLVYYSAGDGDAKPASSNIVITDLYESGKEVNPGENSILEQPIERTEVIHLKDRMNNIGFRFVDLNFINPGDNHYLYMLQGFDSEWSDNGSSNSVFYHDLKSGNYLFLVKNAIKTDHDTSNIAEVRIVIHKTFIGSNYFYIILFFLVIAGVFILIRYKAKLSPEVRNIIGLDLKYEKYKGSRIPKDQYKLIIGELKQYMEEGKPYLNPDLKIADLAQHVHHPTNEISQVLNQARNQSFSDFVNRYRVKEFKRHMEEGAFEKYTLVAIAQKSGFNSKTSFYRIFKNETGKTPADYLKELNGQDRSKTTK